jgi:hypothetical protein
MDFVAFEVVVLVLFHRLLIFEFPNKYYRRVPVQPRPVPSVSGKKTHQSRNSTVEKVEKAKTRGGSGGQ